MAAPRQFAEAEEQVHQAATAATGLADFGNPDDYLPGLRRVLKAFDTDCRFTESGREFAFGNVVASLIGRLHAQEGWKRHPEYAQVSIRAPLIITGVVRTGTTALHKLLSMDSQFQGLDRWITAAPMVRPPRDTWESNPGYQSMVANLKAYFDAAPEVMLAHEMTADGVDECIEVLKQSFVSNHFPSSFHIPSYDEWFLQQGEKSSYRHYAKVLQLIGLADQDKRWLLKNPGHIWEMDTLLEIFPDACIVQTHRTPVKAIPSLCSILGYAQRIAEGPNVDRKAIGAREQYVYRRALDKLMPVRERHPDRFFDVLHRDFHADPMGIVRAIYDRFGLSLSGAAEQRMRQWIADNPAGKHGEHRYDLTDFGLSEQGLRSTYKDYIDQFGLE